MFKTALPAIQIYPRFWVERMLRNESRRHIIISLTDPEKADVKFQPNPETVEVLRLKFDDIEHPYPNDTLLLMTQEQADEVCDFVLRHREIPLIIVNCEMGICRSSGCAAAIVESLGGDATWIFSSATYLPNRHVYQSVKEAFSRKLGLQVVEPEGAISC